MPWTEADKANVFEQRWAGGKITCPADGAELAVEMYEELEKTFKASCPRCGSSATLSRDDDPRASERRPWTDSEAADLLCTYRSGRQARCPIDGADLLSNPVTNEHLMLLCPRCDRSCTYPV